MKLRDYQQNLKDGINHHLYDLKKACVCALAPTGSGKTVLFTSMIMDHVGACVAVAHRQELVMQMSVTLARFGIKHSLIASATNRSFVNNIVKAHLKETGKNFYDPQSKVYVASVQSMIKAERLRHILDTITLYIGDEGHHTLRDNMWGKAIKMVPKAKVLLVTATPTRTDGKGLGRHADGFIDELIIGPKMRTLIDRGYLCDYKIYCHQSNMDLSDVNVTASGEYNQKKLAKASSNSQIVGDVVEHYLKYAKGKLGITFVTDLDTAARVAEEFNNAGVPAMVVNAKTPDLERMSINEKFAKGELKQLVNVDIFGEGYDLPALEVVSFARPTKSYGMYIQQFGRVLRPKEGKKVGLVIDHVNNVMTHGLPDAPYEWTLDRRNSRSKKKDDSIPLTTCTQCFMPYERIYKSCPHCKHTPIATPRSTPEEVDGDLTLLTPETLAMMRTKGDEINKPFSQVEKECNDKYMPEVGIKAAMNRHRRFRASQFKLRDRIDAWGENQRTKGREDCESYRRFYHKFGIDVLSARTLSSKEADVLELRIDKDLNDKHLRLG